MPRTNLWFDTHKKKFDFHPEIFKKQKECFKCKISFDEMTGQDILQHYYQSHSMWTVIVCDVCGLPFRGKKEVRHHKYITHAH